MKLSLCLAVRNEEKNIHYALDSTIDWVDEVIVVDGGSTDNTLEILLTYGGKVRIIETDNPPMFHINKQKALDAAKGEWILQLDADEEITPELRNEILEIINSQGIPLRQPADRDDRQDDQNLNDEKTQHSDDGTIRISIDRSADVRNQVKVSFNSQDVANPKLNVISDAKSPKEIGDVIRQSAIRSSPTYQKALLEKSVAKSEVFAYQIPRKNFFLGRPLMKGGVYPDYTIRLYKRGAMYFPCRDVHENVEPTAEQRAKSREQSDWLGTLESPMNHYSDPTFGRYLARWKRYTTAEALRVVEEAKKLYNGDKKKMRLWKAIFIAKCFFFLAPYWFAKTYLRHKGFEDGWQGFVFHLMSAVRWWGIGYKVLSAKC